jgi:hypothetical protein
MIGGAAAFRRFVRHDLRLSARGFMSMFGAVSPGRLGAAAAALLAALHAAAWPVAGWLVEIETGPNGDARIATILAAGAMFIIPWIVAQSLTDVTRTLFGRSDLELILSSPVETRSVLAARALAIAIGAVGSVGLALAPLADMAALRGGAHWLALYPALLAAGLMGTGLGVMLAMGLILAVGPRRARVLSQVAATTVGAASCLGRRPSRCCPSGCARRSSRRSSRRRAASAASYGRRCAQRREIAWRFLAGRLSASRSSGSLALFSASASRRRRSSLRARRRARASPRAGPRALA